MEKEYKELLLKDLCARLPYGVKMQTCHCKLTETLKTYMDINHLIDIGWLPYLRHLSSMTDDEKKIYKTLLSERKLYGGLGIKIIDWLNAHHFDYRGLIEKCLALEAPKDMYNIK